MTASLVLAAPAGAQDSPVVVYGEPDQNIRTERVSYADLNLASTSGEKKLNGRVDRAVERVCLFDIGQRGSEVIQYKRCAGGAWDHARPQIAQAVERARQLAQTGTTSIAATAITISVPAN
ncbi:UrcA family protein [Sphingomonas xanthus]|uniref:UrcA family protein n=1 Tax=Sphingomonas xanthus TaxID=2594473 RepID=UPI00164EDA01|nr:UrcA family protein [Sphingomonas xanthus]